MDDKKIEWREIRHILLLFSIVMVSVIILSYLAPHQPTTLSTTTGSVGLAPWQTALGYGIYIAVGSFVIFFILSRLKQKNLFLRVFEAGFIILGIWALLTVFFPTALLAFVPGVLLVFFKQYFPGLTNTCAVSSAIGFGLIFALEFGFAVMFFFLIVLAVYDYLAVYVTKHMVKMADMYVDQQLAFLVYAIRRIDEKTVSSIKLGTGDLIFPSAFVGGMAVSGLPFIMVAGAALGAVAMLAYLLFRVQQTLHAYPAIPYLAFGCFVGMVGGLMINVI